MRNQLTLLAIFLGGIAPGARAQGSKVEVMPVRSGGGAPSVSPGGGAAASALKPGLNVNAGIPMRPSAPRAGVPNASAASKAAPAAAPAANTSNTSYSAAAAPVFGRETSSSPSDSRPGKATAMDAAGDLNKTVREMKAREDLAGGPSPVVEDAFRPIFDAASPVKTSVPEASSVAGKVQDVKSHIKHLVQLGNTAPAANAPSFYASAIKTAEESFTKADAEQLTRVVLQFAEKKAKTDLPQLAEQSYEAASAGDSTRFATVFKAIGSWNGVFSEQGKSLIARFGDLRAANVEKILRAAAGKPSSGGVSGKASAGAPTAVSQKQRDADKKWLVQKPGASEFAVALPVVSIGANVAGTLTASKKDGSEFAAEEAPRPSASDYKNFKVIYGTLRKEGVSRFGSFGAAARYWIKSSWTGTRQAARGGGPSDSSSEAFSRLSRQYNAALQFGALHAAYLDLRSARALLEQGRQAARSFEDLTGDGSALSAFSDLERRLEARALGSRLTPEDRLDPALSHLILSRRGYSVRYWLDRIYDKAQVYAGQGGTSQASLAQVEREALRRGAEPRIVKLLSDMKHRPQEARRLAASIQSEGWPPQRFVGIGQVGDYLAQSAVRRSPDGSEQTVTVLLDRKLGRVVFARAE